MRVIQNAKTGMITLDQAAYIQETLDMFGMTDCNPTAAPLGASQRLQRSDKPVDKPYQQLLGRIMYLSICTRPDIAHAVSVLSRFSNSPGEEHWTALKRVLRYLKGTMHF